MTYHAIILSVAPVSIGSASNDNVVSNGSIAGWVGIRFFRPTPALPTGITPRAA